jgi:LAO/AO transport system kinase
MEVADVFVINKADRPGVDQTRRDLELMLDLSELGDWRPPIVATVGSTGEGVDALWQAVLDHRTSAEKTGVLEQRRQQRLQEELRGILVSRLDARARQLCTGERYDELVLDVLDRRVDPWTAADEVLRAVGA